MQCNVAAGEQKAAMEALSVSERALQRIKQQGCSTTQQDRSIMRQPDYRALPYPQFSDPIVELEYDTNNRYTAANQSAGYIHPFVDEVTAQNVVARPAVPGLSMAGTGDLASIAGSLFSQETDVSAYRRIADSIRGAPLKMSESSPTRQNLAQQRETASLEPHFVADNPITTPRQVTAQLLYGDSGGKPEGFPERCRRHARAALYDLLHYGDISEEHVRAAGCSHRAGYVLSRGGRMPYVLFLVTLLFFAVCLLRSVRP